MYSGVEIVKNLGNKGEDGCQGMHRSLATMQVKTEVFPKEGEREGWQIERNIVLGSIEIVNRDHGFSDSCFFN